MYWFATPFKIFVCIQVCNIMYGIQVFAEKENLIQHINKSMLNIRQLPV